MTPAPLMPTLCLLVLLLVPLTALAQSSVVSGQAPAQAAYQQCQDQLLAAHQHVMIVVQRRDRDEQTLAELVVRLQKLQQEMERVTQDAKNPS